MAEPVHIDHHRQLFLDGHVIEWLDKVKRRVCPVQKHPANPLIFPQAESEPAGYVTYGSVLYDSDERRFKAWCHSVGEPRGYEGRPCAARNATFYFTSADGLSWERPNLDRFPLDGRPTNIVTSGNQAAVDGHWPTLYELFGVSKDPADPDPARRYKMGFLHLERNYHGPGEDPLRPGQRRGLGVAFSPDGIRWSPAQNPVTQATIDGGTYWFFDPTKDRWILYGRGRHYAPEVLARFGADRFFQIQNSGRAVNRTESADFVHWTPEAGELILSADVLDGRGGEIYSLAVFPYEGFYIGLVQMFHNEPDRLYLDIQLAVSRDSVHFERLSDRSPFIPVGDVGDWDRFNNSVAGGQPIRVGDELRFYYAGRLYLHSGALKGPDNGKLDRPPFLSAVGLGTIKLDRFAALQAGFEGGTVRTRPLLYEGRRLHVNANVEFGRLEVSLLDAEGNAIEGCSAEVRGRDATDIRVPLEGLAGHAGQPARLEFTIHNGQLYSFWID